MSKAQKGNKESKKPKANKNQAGGNVSAYKAAQGHGQAGHQPLRKKDLKLQLLEICGSARLYPFHFDLLCGTLAPPPEARNTAGLAGCARRSQRSGLHRMHALPVQEVQSKNKSH